MGCIYENFEGECGMFDGDNSIDNLGCDEEGLCICSEDPDPGYTCESYESDWCCNECGADLNIEECSCEEE